MRVQDGEHMRNKEKIKKKKKNKELGNKGDRRGWFQS